MLNGIREQLNGPDPNELIPTSPPSVIATLIMPYTINMTAEMIREDTALVPDEIEETTPILNPQEPVISSLATQEELNNLAEYIAVTEKLDGPIPDDIRKQFYADLAAADAKIGYVR